MSELYTVTYSAYPSGEFTDTFRVEDSRDIQTVIDVACRNAELRERGRILAIFEDMKTYPAGWNYGDPVESVIALINGENGVE